LRFEVNHADGGTEAKAKMEARYKKKVTRVNQK
jgi:hypothetical protein